MTEQVLLAPSTEIINAMLFSDLDAATAQRAVKGDIDIHEAFLTKLNIQVPQDISMNFVANDDNTVNLVLPYYESIEAARAQAMQSMQDDDLEEVVGGEVVGLIFAGMAIGALVTAGASIGVNIAGTVIGGVIGGVVGATVFGVYVAGATGAFEGGMPEGYDGPGYSELARAAKTGNSLLGR